MYRLVAQELPPGDANALFQAQAYVNAGADFADQVSRAKARFASKPSALFKKIRAVLEAMSGDLVRCSYCEDSCADEVEHIRPKDFYPDQVFSWANYLFSCGPCNGGKNNHFSIVDSTGNVIDLRGHRKTHGVIPPPTGQEIFIDPRTEDPLDFLWLDTVSTFRFVPLNEDSLLDRTRAELTRDLLRLDREMLVEARKNAFSGYFDRLEQHIARANAGAPQSELNDRIKELKRSPHRTVWLEMKRQRTLHPRLDAAFQVLPSALNW